MLVSNMTRTSSRGRGKVTRANVEGRGKVTRAKVEAASRDKKEAKLPAHLEQEMQHSLLVSNRTRTSSRGRGKDTRAKVEGRGRDTRKGRSSISRQEGNQATFIALSMKTSLVI